MLKRTFFFALLLEEPNVVCTVSLEEHTHAFYGLIDTFTKTLAVPKSALHYDCVRTASNIRFIEDSNMAKCDIINTLSKPQASVHRLLR